jgi:hypothetical protein
MTAEAIVKAAMSVARDAAEGRLDPADVEQAAATEAAALFATVVGPADPLWATQVAVARRVLALGGVSTDELREWVAVSQPETDPQTALDGP